MNVRELEDAVWATEEIRIVIRANVNTQVGDYNYNKAAKQAWRIRQLIENRIQPLVDDEEVVVIQGDGELPHGGVILRTLRASYHNQ